MRAFIAIATTLLLVAGCAHPHRAAVTTREIWVYEGRPDHLVRVEKWTDSEKGGGTFFLADSQVAALTAIHTNQTDLGGGSSLMAGPMSVQVDPQTGAIISATGAAAGNIIGAALKTAVKP